MCMLIISDMWKNKGVCMRLLRYMRDTFLELDTSLNDELVKGKINKSVSLHIVGVSNKYTLCSLWIKCLPLLRGFPAHAREPKMRKWFTSSLRLLQAL
jgi:hypothetical protein